MPRLKKDLKSTDQPSGQVDTRVSLPPKIVNNGNVFGTGNWYTFYCGKCGRQLVGKVKYCEYCNTKIEWSN